MGKNGPSSPFLLTSTLGPKPHSAHSDTQLIVSTLTPSPAAISLNKAKVFLDPDFEHVGPVHTTIVLPLSRGSAASDVTREERNCDEFEGMKPLVEAGQISKNMDSVAFMARDIS